MMGIRNWMRKQEKDHREKVVNRDEGHRREGGNKSGTFKVLTFFNAFLLLFAQETDDEDDI